MQGNCENYYELLLRVVKSFYYLVDNKIWYSGSYLLKDI